VWWSLSRLRLAIELDCDARVLRRGVQPRPYGSLLIDIAGQSAGHRIGALALADRTSHLERRLLAMKHSRTRFALARAGALCAIAFLSVAVACEARLPTSAEVDAMSVEGAERAAVNAKLFAEISDMKRIYLVDGVIVSEADAHAIAPIKIASIDIRGRKSAADKDEVRIYTLDKTKSINAETVARLKTTFKVAADRADTVSLKIARQPQLSKKSFDGLLLVDGVETPSEALAELSRDKMASVEVFKGAAAAKMSTDPRALNGIISIKMKAAQQ
jgi:hypothetical protein